MGHLTDFASLYSMVGSSESESSPCNSLTGVVCGVIVGVVPSVGVPLPFAAACEVDVCGSSGCIV